MEQSGSFNILDSVDSTNNYAMAKLHEGSASNGMAWFAREQTAGKGQRGKQWQSGAGQNIVLSIVLQPGRIFRARPFYFSALIALCCHDILLKNTQKDFFIKWPNDLYWNDRKAGGILIENIFAGMEWKWAVVGIGINVNQDVFEPELNNPISLKQISGKEADPVALARELHAYIVEKTNTITEDKLDSILQRYNELLYKKNEEVKLRKANAVFATTIKTVNEFGQLMTQDSMERNFDFGEVEWVL